MAERVGDIIRRARLAMEPPMSQQALGEAIGHFLRGPALSKGAVSAWENHRALPNPDHARAIAMTLKIPLHWISGDPSQAANVSPKTDGGRRFVPKIDWVCAGQGASAVDPYPKGVGVDYVEVPAKFSDLTFALEVRGSSMEPDFSDGDTIIVDPSRNPNVKTGDFVVVELLPDHTPEGQGNVLFRKYVLRGAGKGGGAIFDLVASNPEEPTITVHSGNPGRLIGKVVSHTHDYE